MKEKYYVIANNDNTKFIGRDAASGGYPYVTDMFQSCLIGNYEYINKYHEGLESYIVGASNFSVKRIVLEVMKELTIEQKARAYDEALERAKQFHKKELFAECNGRLVEYIFPELQESEDGRIRRGIIRNLKYLMDRAEGFVKDELKERIDWLEKQGEENPAAPQKVGNKVINN